MKRARVYDPLGLFSVKAASSGTPPEPLFLPRLLPLANEVEVGQNVDYESEIYSKFKSGDDPSEVFGVREYRPGDPQKSIHWKLTSKRDTMIIKERSLPIRDGIVLLAELRRGTAENLSDELSALYSISQYLAFLKVVHRVAFYDAGRDYFHEYPVTDEGAALEGITMLLRASASDDCDALVGFLARPLRRGMERLYYLTSRYGETEQTLLRPLYGETDVRVLLFSDTSPEDRHVVPFSGDMEKGLRELIL